jgi:hypothetical protein
MLELGQSNGRVRGLESEIDGLLREAPRPLPVKPSATPRRCDCQQDIAESLAADEKGIS